MANSLAIEPIPSFHQSGQNARIFFKRPLVSFSKAAKNWWNVDILISGAR